MSMGIGHRYSVQMLEYHKGDLKSCIEFMTKAKIKNSHEWIELWPIVNTKKGTTTEYICQVVKFKK